MKYIIKPDDEQILKACIEQNRAVLLEGHTGTGKTTILREIAKEQGKIIHRVSLNGTTGIEEVVGRWLVKDGSTYWQDGILTRAMKAGEWVVFDEINAALPEILFCLHSVLDDDKSITLVENDCLVIHAHPNFRFFATMNPSEDYAGTKELNRALASRFSVIIKVDVPDHATEFQILTEIHDVKSSHATTLIDLANKMRELKKNDEILYYCSTRDIIQAGKLAKTIPLNLAIDFCIKNKMQNDEIQLCKERGILNSYITILSKTYAELLSETKDEISKEQYEREMQEKDDSMQELKERLSESESKLDDLNEILEKVRKLAI